MSDNASNTKKQTVALILPAFSSEVSPTNRFLHDTYWTLLPILRYAMIIAFLLIIFRFILWYMRRNDPIKAIVAKNYLKITIVMFSILLLIKFLIDISPSLLRFPLYLH